MKTDWLEGEVFCYCINKDSGDRGTLVGVPIGSKHTVEHIWDGCVASDGLIFYFDEIKPVIQVKGEVIWKHLNY